MAVGCSSLPVYLLLEDGGWELGLLGIAVVYLMGVMFNRLAARVRKEHRRRKRPRNQPVRIPRIRGGHRLKRN